MKKMLVIDKETGLYFSGGNDKSWVASKEEAVAFTQSEITQYFGPPHIFNEEYETEIIN